MTSVKQYMLEAVEHIRTAQPKARPDDAVFVYLMTIGDKLRTSGAKSDLVCSLSPRDAALLAFFLRDVRYASVKETVERLGIE